MDEWVVRGLLKIRSVPYSRSVRPQKGWDFNTSTTHGGSTMASQSYKSGLKRSALTVALGLCFAGGVHAQSTTGSVYGTATPGDTVTVVSESGFARTVAVDSTGHYNISN